jgi:hypothetical protein
MVHAPQNQPNKQTENTKKNQLLLLFYCACIIHLDHSGVDTGPTYGGEGEGGPVEAVYVLGQQVRVPLRHGTKNGRIPGSFAAV